jgi:hypothetical protein
MAFLKATRRIRESGRVGGSTIAHRVSNARAQSRIAGESFMFPGAELSARLGDGAHD